MSLLEPIIWPVVEGVLISSFVMRMRANTSELPFLACAVDVAKVVVIVADACRARNGWKVILGRCAPPARRRRVAPADAGTRVG